MIVTLKDITTKITKGTTPTSIGCKFEKSGINFIKSESLVDGKTIDKSKFAFISERTHERLKRSQIEENDILFSMAGMFLGKTGIATAEVVPANTNQAVAIIRVDDTKANYEYVYYYLNQKSVIHTINTTSAQSAQPNINLKQIGKIKINLPNRKKQDQIVSLLSAIDLKISNNVEINDNLLRQAQALYKNRFIDLKPFNGEMPPDWQLGTVSEIIELHDSKRIPLSSRERANLTKIYPYYGATSVMDYVDRYLFDGIYLLLGEDGTVVDDKGFPILQYVEGKFWVNNHAHIITGKNGFTVETLYLLFSLTNVRSIVTGAVQPKISQANLNNVSVVIPSKAELSTFNSIVQPIFSQIRNLRAESDRLTSTRDILLPRLMSGEIDVSAVHL